MAMTQPIPDKDQKDRDLQKFDRVEELICHLKSVPAFLLPKGKT
jgi:hypothetical protein